MTATKPAVADEPKTLLGALLKFQADPPHLALDANNPHFKSRFVSLPEVMKRVLPKLNACGLVWTTCPSRDDAGPTLRYRLAHAPSGESETGEMPLLLVKNDPQGLGSAITYARRYALLAVLGLVGDDDDDANAASTPTLPPTVAAPSSDATKAHIKQLVDRLAAFPGALENFQAWAKDRQITMADATEAQLRTVINKLEQTLAALETR